MSKYDCQRPLVSDYKTHWSTPIAEQWIRQISDGKPTLISSDIPMTGNQSLTLTVPPPPTITDSPKSLIPSSTDPAIPYTLIYTSRVTDIFRFLSSDDLKGVSITDCLKRFSKHWSSLTTLSEDEPRSFHNHQLQVPKQNLEPPVTDPSGFWSLSPNADQISVFKETHLSSRHLKITTNWLPRILSVKNASLLISTYSQFIFFTDTNADSHKPATTDSLPRGSDAQSLNPSVPSVSDPYGYPWLTQSGHRSRLIAILHTSWISTISHIDLSHFPRIRAHNLKLTAVPRCLSTVWALPKTSGRAQTQSHLWGWLPPPGIFPENRILGFWMSTAGIMAAPTSQPLAGGGHVWICTVQRMTRPFVRRFGYFRAERSKCFWVSKHRYHCCF